MSRSNKSAPKKSKVQTISTFELILSWAIMFVYGVLPTAVPHLLVTLFYTLTMDNPDLGYAFPHVLRVGPTLYLLYRLYTKGREGTYRIWIAAGLIVSMVGDLFFMRKDETSFLIAMGCYAVMHLTFIKALGFEYFGGVGLGASAVIAMMWNLLVLPHLTDYFNAIVPPYIFLVCVTFWRGSAQRELDRGWTKICAAIGTLFFLIAHLNFSLNVFVVVSPFDYLNFLTITMFATGQLLMAISTFEDKYILQSASNKKK